MGYGERGSSDGALIEVSPNLPPGFLVMGTLKGLVKKSSPLPRLPSERLCLKARVEAQPVSAYAELCGFSPQQGVPLTWPAILSFPLQMRLMMGGSFPYSALGLVHLRNHIRQMGRLDVGDELSLTCQAGQLFQHDRGQAFSLEVAATCEGALIWSSSSLYLRRGILAQGSDLTDTLRSACDHKIDNWRADLSMTRRYARLSGDANPIHTSRLGAKLLGFSKPLAHGMWTKARALSALLPSAPVDVAEAEVSFRNPLFLPGEAELYGASRGTVRDFECRDLSGARTYLRGRLSLS